MIAKGFLQHYHPFDGNPKFTYLISMFWDYFGSTQLCAVCNLLFDAGFGLDLVEIDLFFSRQNQRSLCC